MALEEQSQAQKDIAQTLHRARISGIGTHLDYIDREAPVELAHRIKFIDEAVANVDQSLDYVRSGSYKVKLAVNYAKHQSTGEGVTQPAGISNARYAWSVDARNHLIAMKGSMVKAISKIDDVMFQLSKAMEETDGFGEEWNAP